MTDGSEVVILTFNFTPQYYKADRDFGIVETDQIDIAAIQQVFDADWSAQSMYAQNSDNLVWSPCSRSQLIDVISSATSSLDLYNEEMGDAKTISALEAAAKRSVNVGIVMTYSANWKAAFQHLADADVRVRTYAANAPFYIHAKVIVVDVSKDFIGSEKISAKSLGCNRELGIMISDSTTIS